MEQEQQLSARQSLHLISEIIGQTKDNFKQHSFIFILWGWTLASASVIRFILETQTTFKYYFVPFPILAGVALVATISFYRKNGGSRETHLNFFLTKL
jgi:hypothetical protein